MAFDEDEKNELRLIFHEGIEPIRDLVNKHNTVLFGVNGQNGHNGDIKIIKDKVNEIHTDIVAYKRAVKWIAASVSGAIGAASTVITQYMHK